MGGFPGEVSAIRFGNQMGATGKTATHDTDWKANSGTRGRTSRLPGQTGWAFGAGGAGSSPAGGATAGAPLPGAPGIYQFG
jgi:hypothetical protein